ncbi:MAG: hypothetical protein P8L17_01225 [Methylophilaceae bacterium]|nr:hypothetical protein [Methylophilaceae bacterium]MDG1821462.1 hypothetical protein [Methylophilaceae bacterium]MDG2293059.1 hypothetical protein [Methylophilaceae bacterium]
MMNAVNQPVVWHQYCIPRTLYSLRHTSITFRLHYGQGIDMLTLARNARTSVKMIE